MPKISVLVAVYNTAEYLPHCLDSLLNQTLKDVEVVCIDDASTDDSLDILHQYAARDTRLRVIALDENRGQAHARNIGLSCATGDYIGFVDSDDCAGKGMRSFLPERGRLCVVPSVLRLCGRASEGVFHASFQYDEWRGSLPAEPDLEHSRLLRCAQYTPQSASLR